MLPFLLAMAALASDEPAGADHPPAEEPHPTGHEEEGHPPDAGAHAGEHTFHPHALVGATVGAMHPGGEHAGTHAVGGLFGAWIVSEQWLEVELAVKNVSAEPTSDVAVLLAKKPFHVSHAVHPFVGVGPSMSVLLEEEHTTVHPGFEAVVGTYVWGTPHLGVTIEVSEGAVAEDGLVWETGGSLGVAVAL